REVPEREIDDAIASSGMRLRETDQPNHVPRAVVPWPKVNDEKVGAIVRSGPTLADLKSFSPVRFEDGQSHAEEVVDLLFPGNPLLCVGATNSVFDTRPRNQWCELLSQNQFIVPSPMTAIWGITKGGKQSKHTLENTGPRRFLVIEFDPPDWQ